MSDDPRIIAALQRMNNQLAGIRGTLFVLVGIGGTIIGILLRKL